MSENDLDDVVTAIVNNFTLGVTCLPEAGLYYLERAVHNLRAAAADHTRSISQEQRQQIDQAIRAAQPVLAPNTVAAEYQNLRILVGALHIVVAEWANPNRAPLASAPSIIIEAFALARMLDNNLNDTNILSGLRRQRARLDPTQLAALRNVVDQLYPPDAVPEPAPYYATGSIN